jgi:hypothetical protein
LQFKNGTNLPIEKTGSIVVYNSNLVNEPIIHRAVAKLHAKDGYYVLTKGDSIHNNTFDQDCGRIFPYGPERQCITLYPVPIGELQGVSVLQIPIVGCAKLWLFDNLGSLISTGKLPSNFSGIC